jgi:hypothetical protein
LARWLLINDVHLHFLLLYKKKFEETFTDKEEKERERERERERKREILNEVYV